jgi:rare lipoprotein A (peptidoglycan hydrolase)
MSSGSDFESDDPLERAGQSILRRLQQAADAADQNSQQAVEMAQKLSQQLHANRSVAPLFTGRRRCTPTANGEHVDCTALTAAHRTLPFGTQVKVCHHGCVTVQINDRGPFVRGRDIDLTPAAARAIGLEDLGRAGTLTIGIAATDFNSVCSRGSPRSTVPRRARRQARVCSRIWCAP